MTREGAEIIRGAMEMIYKQCKATSSCENCPLYECCQDDGLFEVCPGMWLEYGGLK